LIGDKLLPLAKLDWEVPRKWYAPVTGGQITWIILIALLFADTALGVAVLLKLF